MSRSGSPVSSPALFSLALLRSCISLGSSHTGIALLGLFLVSTLAMFNVYSIGAKPVWDGDIYHRLVLEFLAGGSKFSSVHGDFIGPSQLKLAYLHRPLFIGLVGILHRVTGVEIHLIYPLLNLLSLTFAAFYVYLIVRKCCQLTSLLALTAASWMLVSPAVLVIHQSVASAEPLVLFFTAASYYYFLSERRRTALYSRA